MSDKLQIRPAPNPDTVAQWSPKTKEWSIVVEGQWVRLDYLIDSLINMRIALNNQFKGQKKVP